MKAVSHEIPHPLTTKICLKITHLEFDLNLPGANELKSDLFAAFPNVEQYAVLYGMLYVAFVITGSHALLLPSII